MARNITFYFTDNLLLFPAVEEFLPRCMEFRRGLAMRIENSVCLSVCLSVHLPVCLCLSVKRMDCDKTEERSVHIFIPHKRSF